MSRTLPSMTGARLLEYALAASDFQGSVRDCHVKGLSSIVLFDRRSHDGGMLRFFYADPAEHPLHTLFADSGHFTLGVHNHRYDLTLEPLVGNIVNVEVTSNETAAVGDPDLYEFAFTSGLDGEMTAVPTATRGLDRLNTVDLAPGMRRRMESTALHTVVVPAQDRPVAWLVHEGPPTGTEARIYSMRPDLALSSDGLYQPMTRSEACLTVSDVLRRMS